ncbi:GNAT family N-acetyltransferase, partial [Nocardiopsis tropica]|nr:GNAT family N-acetyltransferase [Nocardiopsis tropica]
MLRTSPVRILGERDREAVRALLDADPVGNVFVASRLMATGLAASAHGAEVWGHVERGRLTAMCYSGTRLAPE